MTSAGTRFKVQLTGNVREEERASPGRGAQTRIFRGRLQGTESSVSNPVLRVSALWDGTPLKAETLAKLLGQIVLHVFSSWMSGYGGDRAHCCPLAPSVRQPSALSAVGITFFKFAVTRWRPFSRLGSAATADFPWTSGRELKITADRASS